MSPLPLGLDFLRQTVSRSDDVKGLTVPPRRWAAQETAGWLVRNPRLARDYERLTACSPATIKVAIIRLTTARVAGHKITWADSAEREAMPYDHRRPTRHVITQLRNGIPRPLQAVGKCLR